MSNECLYCGKARKAEVWPLEDYCSAECKRKNECRYCGAKRNKNIEWPYEDYCSGKCKKADGGEIEPVSERAKNEGRVATFADYLLDYPKNLGGKDKRGQRIKGRMPKIYIRRWEPERLNWGPTTGQLKQAGFRANRKPLPGDFDYAQEPEVPEVKEDDNDN